MNLHWHHEVHVRAKARGCDVLLHGGRGNASLSFTGDGRLPSLLRRGHLAALHCEISAVRRKHRSYLHAFASRGLMPLMPDRIYHAVMRRRPGPGSEERPEQLPAWCGMNPDWADAMWVRARADEFGFDPHFRRPHSTLDLREKMMRGSGSEAGDLLPALEAINGTPIRDPTSYRPFFEFCAGIPDDQYLRNGTERWLAKRLLKGKLPDVVLDENSRGRQAADWHVRLGRQLPQLIAEVKRLRADPAMCHRFDLAGMRQALADWPAETPLGSPLAMRLNFALPRMLATARYIRFVQGRND